MDFVTHSLWGLTAVRKRNLFWLTLLFSVLPDFPYFFYKLGLPQTISIKSYYFTHSFLAVFLIFSGLFFLKRSYLILTLPYLFHILIDIPTHCGLFATRFLDPFSDFNLCGWRFEEHALILLFINYGLLLLINLFIWQKNSESKKLA